ncbi:HPr-rel-A system PqqD family peptide chaperone [Sphingomonas sp. IC-56]|uniref:HPr-rel-A system PqqD family peptide chaperone n=1 Tax=Sphingomonas sp. IC-56 TaxID=2898529 RepID=UPI001E549B5D|nr:HPr-rel-A system PqqD family peptide chaperone [Sphingomonas sp. IC-56]
MEAATYRAAPDATLRVVPLDALTLIFHRASGITHVVDSPVPEILELLGDDALTTEQLLARLADHFAVADADADALRARLDELVVAGLVERRCAT